jgi:hypothetical protein
MTTNRSNTATFSRELITAARAYLDQPAVYHQDFAGDCYQSPSEKCYADGLGPDVFDCSGFIVRTICDVTGLDIAKRGLRHVRDMWEAAQAGEYSLTTTTCAPGSIIVTERVYDFGRRPGHIGIITSLATELPTFIHASPSAARVEERPLLRLDTTLGYMTISL